MLTFVRRAALLRGVGLLALPVGLLGMGCEQVFAPFVKNHPDNCVQNPGICSADQFCSPDTQGCEPKVDCRTAAASCTNGLFCNQNTGLCETEPPPPRVPTFGVCRQPTYCWDYPMPQGNALNGLWASSPSDVWAVGAAGTILRYNGSVWNAVESNVQAGLNSVFGLDSQNIWAVGSNGTALRWDGTTWAVLPKPNSQILRGVWAASQTSVFAVGDSGTVANWNGTAWTLQSIGTTSQNLYSVWGASPTDVWLAGTNGRTYHFDGSMWMRNEPASPSSVTLRGVSGSAGNNVWAVGNGGTMQRYTGSWMNPVSPFNGINLSSVHVLSTTAALAVGNRPWIQSWNGTAWSQLALPATPLVDLNAVWAESPNTAWAAGDNGMLVRLAAGTPTLRTPLVAETLRAVVRTPSGELWAAADAGKLFRRSASGWDPTTVTTTRMHKVFALPNGRLFAVGDASGTVAHFFEYVGGSWTPIDLGAYAGDDLDDVWGSDENNLWLVGGNGLLLRYNAGTLSAAPRLNPMNHMRSVWGLSASSIWAVGDSGRAVHFDGQAWTTVQTGTTEDLRGVWGRSEQEFWAVGTNGTSLFYDGTRWKPIAVPPAPTNAKPNLENIHGLTKTGELLAVGDSGTVLRWKSGAWELVFVGTEYNLSGVFVQDRSNAWITGQFGTVLTVVP